LSLCQPLLEKADDWWRASACPRNCNWSWLSQRL